MKLTCTGGRYPGPFLPPRHERDCVTAELAISEGVVTLRIEDEKLPDRWEEFSTSAAGLAAWLAHHLKGGAGTPPEGR